MYPLFIHSLLFYPPYPTVIHSLPFRGIPSHRSGYFSSSSPCIHARQQWFDCNNPPADPVHIKRFRSSSSNDRESHFMRVFKGWCAPSLISYLLESPGRTVQAIHAWCTRRPGGNALPPRVKAPFLKSRRSENATGEMIGIYWLYNLDARSRRASVYFPVIRSFCNS